MEQLFRQSELEVRLSLNLNVLDATGVPRVMSLAEALGSTDATVGKLKVVSLLESLPGVGKVKARKIMDDIGIADNRRVQGLGQQQKASLLDQLGK